LGLYNDFTSARPRPRAVVRAVGAQ
jgi:hypothetical protein